LILIISHFVDNQQDEDEEEDTMENFIRHCEKVGDIKDWSSEEPGNIQRISERMKDVLFPISHCLTDVIFGLHKDINPKNAKDVKYLFLDTRSHKN
jgi:hypothetical protein